MSQPVYNTILEEQNQGHKTRKKLFKLLESELDCPVVTFFTSFVHPVMIENADADMIESVLQTMNLAKGLALIISSPGGDGLAAERIINICKSYSGTNTFKVIIPSKAKSAATIVSFGASEILAGATSELGPVDPQIRIQENGSAKQFSVFNIVKSYDILFQKAVEEKSGNLQPYLQQLANYDEKDIAEYRMALELSEDIAIRALQNGMMVGKSDADIKKLIGKFLSPTITKTHGRPIYRDDALACGLNIKKLEVDDKIWEICRELFVRTNHLVSTHATKCIENSQVSFTSGVQIN
jgi:ClpP class serine protease